MNKIVKSVSILMVISLLMSQMLVAFAQNNDDEIKQEPELLINEYYNNINNGNIEDAFELYSENLLSYVYYFLNDKEAENNCEGIFNVKKVDEIQCKIIKKDDSRDNQYDYIYSVFTKCKINVHNSDKYYREGENYFIFYIGEKNEKYEITNIEIPSYGVILRYEENEEAALSFQKERNMYIYGYDKNSAVTYSDAPVYVDYVSNPSSIRVKTDDGIETVDFKTYLKRNAAVEFNSGLSKTDEYRAAAMAAKMIAVYKILTAGSGANYDINTVIQGYSDTKTLSSEANAAVNYVYNYFLLDCYGAVFPTFYRTEESDSSYCKQNGGILAQKWADNDINGWQNALRYYYTRVDDVDYYNKSMNTGDLIITSSHVHDWSGGEICSYCGAEAY